MQIVRLLGRIGLDKSSTDPHNEGTMSLKYTIRKVADRTGLSHHTIRAWERRYGALKPVRSDTNQRLYDEEEVRKLALLKHAVEAGHSIRQVANLSIEELSELEQSRSASSFSAGSGGIGLTPADCLVECESALDRLDQDALMHALIRGNSSLGVSRFIEEIVIPFLAWIERQWTSNALTIAQEHLASAVLRTYLEQVRVSIPMRPNSAKLLVTTPKGQFHEIGALIVSVVSAMESWDVTYLGPNLPAHEIAGAFKRSAAHAVALSLVYPTSDEEMTEELLELRRALGPAVPIFLGGRAADSYSVPAQEGGMQVLHSLDDLRSKLDTLRLKLLGSRSA